MKNKSRKRTVVLMIDGLPTFKFEKFIKAGYLPNMKALMKQGTYVSRCSSAFPSVTGPGHVPMFTGKDPFYFEIVGHDQFYRNYRYFDNFLFNYKALNDHFKKHKTIFDYYQDSVALGELVYKGAKSFVRYFSGVLSWLFRWDINTDLVLRRMLKEYDAGRDLIVAWICNSDAFQHISKTDKNLIKVLKKVDQALGILMMDKDLRIFLCSDHGMETVKKRVHIKRALYDMGLRINKMKFNFDGGAFAQIYFKHPEKDSFWYRKMSYKRFKDYAIDPTNFDDLMRKLASSKFVEFLMVDHVGQTYIFAEHGVASIEKRKEKFMYKVLDGMDPFKYSKDKKAKNLVNKWISKDDCLKYSAHTLYPDAIYQAHGLLQLKNSGEMVVTSEPGITWNFITPRGAHGGLREDQMISPFISSEKNTLGRDFMRAEEIYNLIVEE